MIPAAETDACTALQQEPQQRPAPLGTAQPAHRTSATGTAESSGCIEILAIAPEAARGSRDAQRRGSGSSGGPADMQPGEGLAHVLLRERELLRRLEVAEAARAEQDALRARAERAEATQQETRRTCMRELVWPLRSGGHGLYVHVQLSVVLVTHR